MVRVRFDGVVLIGCELLLVAFLVVAGAANDRKTLVGGSGALGLSKRLREHLGDTWGVSHEKCASFPKKKLEPQKMLVSWGTRSREKT